MPAFVHPSRPGAARSGQSGRIWFFFNEAVPATLARKLGFYALTETMERCPEIGLDTYDRFFPNQNTLPLGGFGSLVALPLQNRPRKAGNSVFVNENIVPFDDQWAFLSTIPRMNRPEIERLVKSAEPRGRIMGAWSSSSDEVDHATPQSSRPSRRRAELPGESLPRNLELALGNEIRIEKDVLPPGSSID